MASILDMSASSDSEDDVDYVPTGAASDSSFDEEEDVSGDEIKEAKKTKEKTGAKVTVEADGAPAPKVNEKDRAKMLWESFLNDVESPCVTSSNNSSPTVSNEKVKEKVENESDGREASKTVTNTEEPIEKVFEFAGETIAVDKDLNCCASQPPQQKQNNSGPDSTAKPPVPIKRGLDSVLGTLMNKKKKLNVLEKSQMDWHKFKKDNQVENELLTYNKGKNGFIERQRFLERSDLRSFELEKSMRQTQRKK